MSQSLMMVQPAAFVAPKPAVSTGSTVTSRSSFGNALDKAESQADAHPEAKAAQPEAQATATKPQPTGEDAAKGDTSSDTKANAEPKDHTSKDAASDQAPTQAAATPSVDMLQVMVPNVIQVAVPPAPVQPVAQASSNQSVAAVAVAQQAANVQVSAAAPTTQAAAAAVGQAASTASPPAIDDKSAQTNAKPAAAPVAQPQHGQLASLVKQADGKDQDSTGQDAGSKDQGSKDQGSKQSKAPVAPVSNQSVPQSLDSLKASANMTSLKSNPQPIQAPAPTHVTAQAPQAAKSDKAADAASAIEHVDTPAPTTEKPQETIQPWQLPHPVQMGDATQPQARVLDANGNPGDAQPVRDVVQAHITQAVTDANKPAELRLQLSPENLGRMEIRVIAHEGTVSAQIRVDHAESRDLIQNQIADLKQNLADQGIKIDKLEVNVGGDHQRQDQGFNLGAGMQQQMNQQHQQQQAFQATNNRYGRYHDGALEPEEEGLDAVAPAALSGATAVDYVA